MPDYRQQKLYPGTFGNVELTEEQQAKVKAVSWPTTIEKFKAIYSPHGIYTPFMEEREKRLRAIQKT